MSIIRPKDLEGSATTGFSPGISPLGMSPDTVLSPDGTSPGFSTGFSNSRHSPTLSPTLKKFKKKKKKKTSTKILTIQEIEIGPTERRLNLDNSFSF